LLHVAKNQLPDPPYHSIANGSSNATFKFENQMMDGESAEGYCNGVGGHVVAYTT
jgi:hypothetical protein